MGHVRVLVALLEMRKRRPTTSDNNPFLSYYGGPTHECPFCGAFFWFQERVKSASAVTQRRIVYNLCCKGGRIRLEPYKKPPEPLRTLLRLCLPKVPNLSGTTSLTGGSSCKWYVNPQVPEATSLAARKCLKKTKPHGDAYKCSAAGCGHVGPPNPRYKLLITAGDKTGETDFILFGRMAQRIVKKPLDILIADNPARFIPDEITRMMEKVYTFNVSFTDNTIALGNVCFQVNTVVTEIGDGGQRARSPTPLSKGGSSATRQVARKILGGSVDKIGHGDDLAFGIADSSLDKLAF
uniref:Replication factor A C-terminal domain-containing protein n=1 Tax=Zea mays TaxID=4577 RepID=A0A804P2Y1_MAIZE